MDTDETQICFCRNERGCERELELTSTGLKVRGLASTAVKFVRRRFLYVIFRALRIMCAHVPKLPSQRPARQRTSARTARGTGADALSHAELIAILLRTGLKGTNAVEIGRQLLQKFGTLQALAQASVDDLQQVRGIGRDKAVTLVAAFALARKMAGELRHESPVLDNPGDVVQLLREDNRLQQRGDVSSLAVEHAATG